MCMCNCFGCKAADLMRALGMASGCWLCRMQIVDDRCQNVQITHHSTTDLVEEDKFLLVGSCSRNPSAVGSTRMPCGRIEGRLSVCCRAFATSCNAMQHFLKSNVSRLCSALCLNMQASSNSVSVRFEGQTKILPH